MDVGLGLAAAMACGWASPSSAESPTAHVAAYAQEPEVESPDDGMPADATDGSWRLYLGCRGAFDLGFPSGHGIFEYDCRCYSRELSYAGVIPARDRHCPRYYVFRVAGSQREFAFQAGLGTRRVYVRSGPRASWCFYQCARSCRPER